MNEFKIHLLDAFTEILADRHTWWVKAVAPTPEAEQNSLREDLQLLSDFSEALEKL